MTITEAQNRASETIEVMRGRITNAVRYCEAYEGTSRTLVVDGSMYSPSTRALPGAAAVWEQADDEAWQTYEDIVVDGLEQFSVPDGRTDEAEPEHWSVGWEDGCLWAYAPEYSEQD